MNTGSAPGFSGQDPVRRQSTGQGPTKCLNFHLPFGLDFGSKEKKKGKGETKGKGVKLKGCLEHTKRKKKKEKGKQLEEQKPNEERETKVGESNS